MNFIQSWPIISSFLLVIHHPNKEASGQTSEINIFEWDSWIFCLWQWGSTFFSFSGACLVIESEVQHLQHQSTSLCMILSHFSPVHIFTIYLSMIQFIIFPYSFDLSSGWFLRGFPIKILYTHSLFPPFKQLVGPSLLDFTTLATKLLIM
jgi:hypothetical protein